LFAKQKGCLLVRVIVEGCVVAKKQEMMYREVITYLSSSAGIHLLCFVMGGSEHEF
jgi:hypothetical protein